MNESFDFDEKFEIFWKKFKREYRLCHLPAKHVVLSIFEVGFKLGRSFQESESKADKVEKLKENDPS